jgi:hypothetical protein
MPQPNAFWAGMTAGYLAERLVRQRLAPAGLDRAETPVVIAGISLAVAMTLIGLRPPARRRRRPEPARHTAHRLGPPHPQQMRAFHGWPQGGWLGFYPVFQNASSAYWSE